MKCELFQINSVVAHRTLVLLSLMSRRAKNHRITHFCLSYNSSESQPISSGKSHKAFKHLHLFVVHWFVEFQQTKETCPFFGSYW